jgi:hypothetical protein
MTTISRRRSFVFALGAGLVAAAFRWRTREPKASFVEQTPPGNRYRTFMVGGRPLYVRDDLVASGRFSDFRAHGREEGER